MERNKDTSRLLSGEEHRPVLHYLGLGSYFKVGTWEPNSRTVTTSQPNSHSEPNAPAWNRFYYYNYVTFSFIKLPWIYFKLFFFFFWQETVFKNHSNSENRSFLLRQWTFISVLKCMLVWLGLCWLKKQSYSRGTWCIDTHLVFKWLWQFWLLVPLCQRWSDQSSVRSVEHSVGSKLQQPHSNSWWEMPFPERA